MFKKLVFAVLIAIYSAPLAHRRANASVPPPIHEYFHSSAYLVFFDKDVSSINVQARKTIVNAEMIEKRWGGVCIELRGLSDTHEQDPVGLSIRRAENVAAQLQFDGLHLPIHLSGAGGIAPLSRQTDPDYNPSKNQRVELIWLSRQSGRTCR